MSMYLQIYCNTKNKSNYKVIYNISFPQICYCGNAVTDLSYLIYTTSTTMFRHEHLDDLLHIYFEDLIGVVRELGLSEKQYHPEFDEFRNEFFKVRQFWM